MTRDEVSNKLVAYFQKNGYPKARKNKDGLRVLKKNSCDLNILLEEKKEGKHVIVHVYPYYRECQFDLGWTWKKTWEATDFERLNKAVDEAKAWIESAEHVRKIQVKEMDVSEVLQKKGDMTYDDLMRANPWKPMIKSVQRLLDKNSEGCRFVLECDEPLIQEMEQNLKGEFGLRLNLPPQPFIGNPNAPVWILQYNPGYSELIDDYNYLGINKFPQHLQYKIIGDKAFGKRLALMCDQYGFKSKAPFYALDPAFNTITNGFHYNGHVPRGMYLWYQSHLFPNQESIFKLGDSDEKQFADQNLFVLERFPYHSLSFREGFGYNALPSFNYWKQLVSFAFQKEKVILVYGNRRGIVKELEKLNGYEEAKASGRIIAVRSTGSGLATLKSKAVNIEQKIRKEHPSIFR